EVFRLLRARLRYFDVDRELRSVLLTSATPGDGKSTVAWNLARTAAQVAPQAEILLLEADLRRPTLSTIPGVDAAPGLSEVLSHHVGLADAVKTVEVGGAASDATLNILTAG